MTSRFSATVWASARWRIGDLRQVGLKRLHGDGQDAIARRAQADHRAGKDVGHPAGLGVKRLDVAGFEMRRGAEREQGGLGGAQIAVDDVGDFAGQCGD